jgi:glycosyltransferase involved in cell wall biosynthesis
METLNRPPSEWRRERKKKLLTRAFRRAELIRLPIKAARDKAKRDLATRWRHGIRRQIKDGENGFLVDNVEQAAECIVQLLQDGRLRERLGSCARETVRENFLMSRLAEDWIDLLAKLNRRSAP